MSNAIFNPYINILINSNKNLKVKKKHCFLYDKIIFEILNDIANNNSEKKSNYYKELFEEKYDTSTTLRSDSISEIFQEKKLMTSVEGIISLINETAGDDSEKSLFVIPVSFSYSQLSIREKINKFIDETHNLLFEKDKKPQIIDQLNASDNLYFLPCLIGKKQNLSETEYISKIRTELSNLKEYIDDKFNNVTQSIFSSGNGEVFNELHKNLVFFHNPDGKLSLEFYKKIYNKEKNVEFLNKHLFRQIDKIQSSNLLERDFVIDDRLYVNSIFTSGSADNNNYIVFLIKKIFELEILSELDLKNIESFYDNGIKLLNIIYKTKKKVDLYDFDTNKLNLSSKYKYHLIDKDKHVILKFEKNNLNPLYHKIKDSGDVILRLKDDEMEIDSDDNFYLKITSSGVLKKASIYIKKVNVYEEIPELKGILSLSPEEREGYKKLKPTNLTREVQSNRIYYIENFDFSLKSLKEFFKQKTNTNGENNLREFFIKIFSNKNLLNDYFLFCLNNSKYKKLINVSFYDDNQDEKDEQIKNVLKHLTKELLKKGNAFWVNISKSETNSSRQSTSKKYNRYIIKRIVSDKITIQTAGDGDSSVEEKLSITNTEERKIRESINRENAVLLEIRLEPDDEDDKIKVNRNMNNNSNTIDIIKPSSKKCFTRKKSLNKQLKKMYKNLTQKIHFKFRSYF